MCEFVFEVYVCLHKAVIWGWPLACNVSWSMGAGCGRGIRDFSCRRLFSVVMATVRACCFLVSFLSRSVPPPGISPVLLSALCHCVQRPSSLASVHHLSGLGLARAVLIWKGQESAVRILLPCGPSRVPVTLQRCSPLPFHQHFCSRFRLLLPHPPLRP